MKVRYLRLRKRVCSLEEEENTYPNEVRLFLGDREHSRAGPAWEPACHTKGRVSARRGAGRGAETLDLTEHVPACSTLTALTPASGTTWGSDSGLWGVSKPRWHNRKPHFHEEGLGEGLGAQVRAPAFRLRHSKPKH